MGAGLLARIICRRYVFVLLPFLTAMNTFADEPTGWAPEFRKPARPWQESQIDLPAYPEEARLLEVPLSSGANPYRIYIDPDSISTHDKGVVRYTVVIISSSGAMNVSYEALRCGKGRYRRYAYGYDGEWHMLKDSDWQKVKGYGMEQYRDLFYRAYLCDASGPQTVDEILRKFRTHRNFVPLED